MGDHHAPNFSLESAAMLGLGPMKASCFVQ